MEGRFRHIAITPETPFSDNEIEFIACILDAGFDYVHVRKPSYSVGELSNYIESMPRKFHSRLKIHDHFELAESLGVGGIHLNRRNNCIPAGFGGKLSKSCHSLEELSGIDKFEYVFLSPIFDSISKTGYRSAFPESELITAKDRGLIGGNVVALGGVDALHIPFLKFCSFGGAAFLGYLFNSADTHELNNRLNNILNQQ